MTIALLPMAEPAGLTRDWMQAALLAAGFDAVLTQLEICPVGTGQMSTTLRVRCRRSHRSRACCNAR
jgi:hypothetical protein